MSYKFGAIKGESHDYFYSDVLFFQRSWNVNLVDD